MSVNIIACITPNGLGAVGLIRISGETAIEICDSCFNGKNLSLQKSHTIHFGHLKGDGGEIIDEVLVSLFKAPHSYTKENTVEISCHGSQYIIRTIVALFQSKGVRMAKPGEFTQRAYLNGRFDLAQAEAVADIIASETKAQQTIAIKQLRGGFSSDLQLLRTELIHFASLIELELDFAEEDVEFANRDDLKKLIMRLLNSIEPLLDSFQFGNAVKNGITAVLAGRPNAGKSTLLNTLLNEERAIVSEIAGTTRDVIEEKITLDGLLFRLIDTAGIREASDMIEKIGVRKTYEQVANASILLYIFDINTLSVDDVKKDLEKLKHDDLKIVAIANKMDLLKTNSIDIALSAIKEFCDNNHYAFIELSALNKQNIDQLKTALIITASNNSNIQDQTIITNARHYESLLFSKNALKNALIGLEKNNSGDLLALEIRHALHALGEITGEISNNDLLDNIFSKFCIGK